MNSFVWRGRNTPNDCIGIKNEKNDIDMIYLNG